MQARLTETAERERVMLLEGPNFSGRTERLRRYAGLPGTVDPEARGAGAQPEVKGAYTASDSHNYLSGLATSGFIELELHGLGACPYQDGLGRLIERLNLGRALAHPFTLSGGEQAILTILSALAMAPQRLALDGVFEQLSDQARRALLDFISGERGFTGQVLVCDNRIAELDGVLQIRRVAVEGDAVAAQCPRISDGVDLTYQVESCPLELHGVSFWYEKAHRVLDNVDFAFEPGRIYLLTGANGVGKSTLSRLLCGILRPKSGRISARNGTEARPWERPAELVAYHFQNPDLQLFNISVRTEVCPAAADQAQAWEQAAPVGRAFGLEGLLEQHPLDLPYVLRKRIAMAAAVAMFRPWLILDEPTLGQDDANCLALIGIIEGLARAGAGVIVISHSSWLRARLPAERLLLESGLLHHLD